MSVVDNYQSFAITKAADYGDPDAQARLWILALGGEIGELANLTKKWLGHGHTLDIGKLEDEAGDVAWYLACLCQLAQLEFAEFVETSPSIFPELPKRENIRDSTQALLLSMQSTQGIMAGMAVYVTSDQMGEVLVASLQRLVALLVELLGVHCIRIDRVLHLNMNKLNARYPTGFSAARSRERVRIVKP